LPSRLGSGARIASASVVAVGVVVCAGWIAGFYTSGVGRAMLVAADSSLFVALIWWTVAALVRADGARRAAEDAARERADDLAITLDSIGDAVIATDPRGHIVRMNTVAERLTGWASADATGRRLQEVFQIIDEDTGAAVESPAVRVLREGTVAALALRTTLIARDGTTLAIADSSAPIRSAEGVLRGVVIVFRDHSEARAAERRLRALAGVSEAFAAVATTYLLLLDTIARTIADLVGDGCLVTLISEDGEHLVNVANAHRDRALELDYRAGSAGLAVPRATSTSISATVIRTGRPLRADVTPTVMVSLSEEELRPLVAKLDVHSYAVVPIRARGAAIGSLSVVRNRPGRGYTEDDITLLQDLADRAGLAIENARLYAHLEQRVGERMAELEATNKELEAFSYSVAHDLRAPLRTISGFSQALLEDCIEHLDPEAVGYATRVRDAAGHMSQLIDGLLELSRIGRAELRRERVDVSAMARVVVARLGAADPGRGVDVVIQADLIARADPRLLEIALTNLLGNAWKFTARSAKPRIEVTVQPGAWPPIYRIQDNGAGFAPAEAGKLFGVFQRLHPTDQFEGTGIGLATVQRIIHRHGGRIWAEGEVDKGATFSFTLEAASSITGRAAWPRSPS
jgi:PAS domain S-box-containing protein